MYKKTKLDKMKNISQNFLFLLILVLSSCYSQNKPENSIYLIFEDSKTSMTKIKIENDTLKYAKYQYRKNHNLDKKYIFSFN